MANSPRNPMRTATSRRRASPGSPRSRDPGRQGHDGWASAELDEPQAEERVARDDPDVEERDDEEHRPQPWRDAQRDADRAEPPGPRRRGAVRPVGASGPRGRRPARMSPSGRSRRRRRRAAVARVVAGPVVEEPGADRPDGEGQAGQEADPRVAAATGTQGVDRDRVAQRLAEELKTQYVTKSRTTTAIAQSRSSRITAAPAPIAQTWSVRGRPSRTSARCPHDRDGDREAERAEGGDEADLGRPESARGEDDRDERDEHADGQADGQVQGPQGDHRAHPIGDATDRGGTGFMSASGTFADHYWPIAVGQPRYDPPMNARSNRIDWLIFLALGFMWGSSYLFIKLAVDDFGTFTLVAAPAPRRRRCSGPSSASPSSRCRANGASTATCWSWRSSTSRSRSCSSPGPSSRSSRRWRRS